MLTLADKKERGSPDTVPARFMAMAPLAGYTVPALQLPLSSSCVWTSQLPLLICCSTPPALCLLLYRLCFLAPTQQLLRMDSPLQAHSSSSRCSSRSPCKYTSSRSPHKHTPSAVPPGALASAPPSAAPAEGAAPLLLHLGPHAAPADKTRIRLDLVYSHPLKSINFFIALVSQSGRKEGLPW